MEPFLLPSSSSSSDHFNLYDEIDVFSSDPFPLSPTPFAHSSPEPLFLVPFRWWNEVREDLYGRGEGTSKAGADGDEHN
ncbi:hypothetical protein Leryth_008824 [Lithospermum erythrorhizon]|nr:hypothetical protein Leryth_008824 [Lithospermum erythrorhizon]